MTVPSLGVAVQGQGIIPADQLNTYVQTADNTAQLRTLTGVSGMEISLKGIAQPNDGGGGDFYWNAAGTEPDDNYNYIQPPGSTGQWWRITTRSAFAIENQGTFLGTAATINALSPVVASLEAGIATLTSSGGGGSELVVQGYTYVCGLETAVVTGTISTLFFDQGQLFIDDGIGYYLPEFLVYNNGNVFLGTNSVIQAGTNITISNTGTAAIISSSGGTGSSGLTELVAGTAVGTGAVTMGGGMGFSGTTNPTLLNEGVISFSGTTGTITLGPSLSMSGQTLDVAGIGTMHAVVGGTVQAVSTLNAGANISFSGTSPQLTLVASTTASANITVENQGTSIGTVGTINALSPVTATISGGIATFTSSGGFTVTDGIYTTSSTLDVSTGLALSQGRASPSVVQYSQGVSNTATLASTPTSGNLLVLFLSSTANPTGFTQATFYSSGASQGYTNILTQQSNGTAPSVAVGASGTPSWFLFEVANWNQIIGANSGATTNVSNTRTFASTTTPTGASLVLWQFNDQSYPTSVILPTGSTLSTAEFNVLNTGVVISANQTTLPELEYSCVSGSPYGAGQITILGNPAGGSASLIADLPLKLNGTIQSGGVSSMTITTGNSITSVSFASGALILNLGTP